jgi:hypothetical protein
MSYIFCVYIYAGFSGYLFPQRADWERGARGCRAHVASGVHLKCKRVCKCVCCTYADTLTDACVCTDARKSSPIAVTPLFSGWALQLLVYAGWCVCMYCYEQVSHIAVKPLLNSTRLCVFMKIHTHIMYVYICDAQKRKLYVAVNVHVYVERNIERASACKCVLPVVVN